jgi:hypothetical protein
MPKMLPAWQCPTCLKIWLKVVGSDTPTCPDDRTELVKIEIDHSQYIAIVQAAGAG